MEPESQRTTSQIPIQKVSSGKTKAQQCGSCFKQFLAFLFSTLGLCCLMVSWSILGGYIFMLLESGYEVQQRQNIEKMRNWTVRRMWRITWEFNVLHEENWTRDISEVMRNYTREVYEAIDEDGWDGKEDGETSESQWSFAGAMLYSITVITTIGYGHIAPKTLSGRMVTILYAIVGIPLTLLTITNLGGFMASAFRFLYKNICCGLCCICCRPPRARSTSVCYNDPESGSVSKPLTDYNGGFSNAPSNRPAFVTWRQGLRRVLTTEDNKRVSVPIYVSLLLITGYILAGATLFTLWEKDWDMYIGSYFCFVTLTTIGFGDFVPGTSVESWDSQKKLVLCALYLLFGLALIAMCFDLMQEEVKNKCKALGRKIGILKDDGSKKKKRKGKRKKRQNKSEKSKRKKGGPPKFDEIETISEKNSNYDSYLQRRGKSPLYDKPVAISYLPKYSETAGSTMSSINASRSGVTDDENEIDGNFEHYEQSKRPILLPKYMREATPTPPRQSHSKSNSVSTLDVHVSENEAPVQITIKRAYTPNLDSDQNTQPND